MVASANDASCPNGTNGSITMVAQGGSNPFEYKVTDMGSSSASFTQFTNNAFHTFNNLPAGIYEVQISDAAGCLTVDTITVNETGVSLNLNDIVVTDISCPNALDGSVAKANPADTTTYTLYDVTGTIAIGVLPQTGLQFGSYVVEVSNGSWLCC